MDDLTCLFRDSSAQFVQRWKGLKDLKQCTSRGYRTLVAYRAFMLQHIQITHFLCLHKELKFPCLQIQKQTSPTVFLKCTTASFTPTFSCKHTYYLGLKYKLAWGLQDDNIFSLITQGCRLNSALVYSCCNRWLKVYTPGVVTRGWRSPGVEDHVNISIAAYTT